MTAQLNYLVPATRNIVPLKHGSFPAWRIPNKRTSDQIHAIKELVAAAFNVTVSDLSLRRGNQKAAWARNVGMWITYALECGTLHCIAAEFGKKNHSTVCYAIQKVNDLRDCYPELREALDNLKSEAIKRLEETR